MLDIFKVRAKSYNLINNYKKGNEVAQAKHYVPSDKEWFNSVYAYNKNTAKLLPVADKVILKLLKSYFNCYSPVLEKDAKLPYLRRRLRRLSTNRMLISRPELKHTSDKVIITVYVYNRQRTYYIRKLQELYTLSNAEHIINSIKHKNYFDLLILRALKRQEFNNLRNELKKKALFIVSKVNKQKIILYKTLGMYKDIIISNPSKDPQKNKKILEKTKKYKEMTIFNSYIKQYLKDFVNKCARLEVIYSYRKQIMLLNEKKFDNYYVLPLTSLIENIYSKKVEFNFVKLKYLYLNSYIFSDTLVTKIRKKKNRVLRVLKASLRMFHLAPIDKLDILAGMNNRKKLQQNPRVNYSEPFIRKKEKSNKKILADSFYNKAIDSISTYAQTWNKTISVLGSIKHKSVTGIRIEAAGRLTRRNTAAKSVFKLKYKGNLKNVDSSYKGLSTTLLRGHAKSNVQYTKLKSKLRIGSFGIKGWVSSN